MDLVYQDEVILGFQQMINEVWLVGVSVIYWCLYNVIDDMNIIVIGQCGVIDGVWIMGNLGCINIVWGDIDCDGCNDGWISIDILKEGWVLYDDNGNYVGQCGWVKFKCDYKVLELQVDCVWDGKWGFNVFYIFVYGCGNVEGLVNFDIDFVDVGCIENFDNFWVNYGGYGYLVNDCCYQFKFCGSYVLIENFSVVVMLGVQLGSLIICFGVGNLFDDIDFYSYYVCVFNCQVMVLFQCVFVYLLCGGDGCMFWIYDLDVSVLYKVLIFIDLCLKLVVYNVFNQQCVVIVDQDYELQDSIGMLNLLYCYGIGFQLLCYVQLIVIWVY